MSIQNWLPLVMILPYLPLRGYIKGGAGKWEWNIADDVNNDSSVRSDFKIEDEAKTIGGLRVSLTFTISTSGLSTPPYIAVSDLSEEDPCPILYPYGILAAKVPGLCKGGDNVGNVSGVGWLVYMCGGRKDELDNDSGSELLEGQPVPESLKVVARIRGPFRDPQSGDRIIERVRANIARYQSLIS